MTTQGNWLLGHFVTDITKWFQDPWRADPRHVVCRVCGAVVHDSFLDRHLEVCQPEEESCGT